MPRIVASRSQKGIGVGIPKSLEACWLERGLRLTEHRRIVLEVLDASHDRPCAREIYRRAADGRRIGFATVYRTLNVLVQAGMITCQVLADGRAHYGRI